MIGSLLVGLMLTVATVGIHAVGTAWWIQRLKRTPIPKSGLRRKLLPLKLLCSTALLLLLLHIIEVSPWATAYLLLPNIDSLNSYEEATYFATVTFASLGYGDIVIDGQWRLLSAIQAMNGLLVFGWSTALLFAVVERIWGDKGTRSQRTESMSSDLNSPSSAFASSQGEHALGRAA